MLTCTTCDGLTPIGSSSRCLHCDTPLRRPPRWALRLTALLGPAGAILLAACYGGPGRYHAMRPVGPHGMTRVDLDGDGNLGGYTCAQATAPAECNAELGNQPPAPDADCDDNDRTRYHGAADTAGDGVDQNCDGVDGESPAHATVPGPLPPAPQ